MSQKFALLFALVIFVSAPLAYARPAGNFGLGVILGAPTALTGKYYTSRDEAYDAGLAFNLGDYILLYGDYLRHFPGGFGHQTQFVSELVPYIGIGPLLVFNNDRNNADGKYFDK